jgi:hypothetical protein
MGYWDTVVWAYGRAPPGPRRPPDILPADCFRHAYAHIYICARASWPGAPTGRLRAIGTYQAYISAYLHIGRWRCLARQPAGRWRCLERQPAGPWPRSAPTILHNYRYAISLPVMQRPRGSSRRAGARAVGLARSGSSRRAGALGLEPSGWRARARAVGLARSGSSHMAMAMAGLALEPGQMFRPRPDKLSSDNLSVLTNCQN